MSLLHSSTRKFAKAAVAAALGIGLMVGAHAAATINSAFNPPGQSNTIQDSDAEWIRDEQGNVKTSGDFVVGDVIVANLRFETINGTAVNVAVSSLNYQLLAYSELEITAITPIIGGYRLTFGSSLGSGVMAQIYEGDPGGFQLSAAPTTGTTQIQANTLIATFGLGEADDFWYADVASLDLQTIATALESAQAAIGSFGLSLLSNPGSLPVGINQVSIVGPDGSTNLHDLVGTASAYQLEDNVNSGYLVSSNLQARFITAEAPEPGMLALVGFGLLGLVVVGRRRQGRA